MLVQENQQATIGWICGILEGEGHFYKKENGFCRIQITNTDFDIIKKFSDFCIKNYILNTLFEEKRKTIKNKKIYVIYISGQDCRNFYNLLGNNLQCRKQEFQQILGASETECDISLDLDWLIGIWEAEGTFYISTNEKDTLVPYLTLENTNLKIIQKLILNIKELGCSWYCKDFYPIKKKSYIRISVNGMKRCYRFLLKTKNLWRSERNIKRSNLMLKYIESRFSKKQGLPYTLEEKQMYNQLKQLNI